MIESPLCHGKKKQRVDIGEDVVVIRGATNDYFANLSINSSIK